MKTILSILCILLACSCSRQNQDAPTLSCDHPIEINEGRYQMHSDNSYTYVIDTKTGQVWGNRHSGSGNTYVGDGKSFAVKKSTL
jgi:hypothetical protein